LRSWHKNLKKVLKSFKTFCGPGIARPALVSVVFALFPADFSRIPGGYAVSSELNFA
jgi:hypothetical protein